MIKFSNRILIISILFSLFLWVPHLSSQSSQSVNQAQVNQAIERGVDYLKGLFKTRKEIGKAEKRVGATALVVYTLLKCDVPLEDKSVAYGLWFLKDQPLTETYQTGLIALAMSTALAKAKPSQSDKPSPKPGNPMLPYYRKKLQSAINWLIKAARPSCGGGGAWGYKFADRVHYDNSNTQFALLGLLAGRNVGIKIPKAIWQKALRHFEVAQCKDGSWGYKASTTGGYPSMTTAGISSMLICLSTLQAKLDLAKTLEDPKITVALKWLEKHWDIYGPRTRVQVGANIPTTRKPAGKIPDYYWLYSLERMGTFAGIEKIGWQNWYAEGAALILKNQDRKGRWCGVGMGGTLPDTCFALLFLKKVSEPLELPAPSVQTPIITGVPKPFPKPIISGASKGASDSEKQEPVVQPEPEKPDIVVRKFPPAFEERRIQGEPEAPDAGVQKSQRSDSAPTICRGTQSGWPGYRLDRVARLKYRLYYGYSHVFSTPRIGSQTQSSVSPYRRPRKSSEDELSSEEVKALGKKTRSVSTQLWIDLSLEPIKTIDNNHFLVRATYDSIKVKYQDDYVRFYCKYNKAAYRKWAEQVYTAAVETKRRTPAGAGVLRTKQGQLIKYNPDYHEYFLQALAYGKLFGAQFDLELSPDGTKIKGLNLKHASIKPKVITRLQFDTQQFVQMLFPPIPQSGKPFTRKTTWQVQGNTYKVKRLDKQKMMVQSYQTESIERTKKEARQLNEPYLWEEKGRRELFSLNLSKGLTTYYAINERLQGYKLARDIAHRGGGVSAQHYYQAKLTDYQSR